MSCNNNGIILAGMQSSGGKTTITSMLLSAFSKRNLPIQPFKVGPDYIDPGYHFHYSGIKSINLDIWIMEESLVSEVASNATKSRFGIVEGVMGLFDGSSPYNDHGSTMEVARLLGWPIVLIVPCRNAGRSITAAIQGFIQEAGGAENFAGVILNQVNGESHATYLRKACEILPIPVLGALPVISDLEWPERHLGLQPGVERKLPQRDELAEWAEKYFDISKLTDLLEKPLSFPKSRSEKTTQIQKTGKKIAVAQDEAFHFYYAKNLRWLEKQGTELIFFSPLHDSAVPDSVDGLILGGGFPEVFAETMSENQSMLHSLKNSIEAGMPTYAECGGLMILTEALIQKNGSRFPMANLIPGTVEMTKSLQNFGYCKVDSEDFPQIRGHEFHYSRWNGEQTHANLWEVTRHSTNKSRTEGFQSKNLRASYVHLYFPQAAAWMRDALHL